MTSGVHGLDWVGGGGVVFVLSSPAVAGKTTLSRLVMERAPGLALWVSVTKRTVRPGEVEGPKYLFVGIFRFEQVAEVQSILKAERLKRERRTGLTTFVRELQRQLQK